jgi:hypothetical protein
MDYFVQLLNAGTATIGHLKGSLRQPASVYRAIGVENSSSEVPDNFLMYALAGLQ